MKRLRGDDPESGEVKETSHALGGVLKFDIKPGCFKSLDACAPPVGGQGERRGGPGRTRTRCQILFETKQGQEKMKGLDRVLRKESLRSNLGGNVGKTTPETVVKI